MGHVIYCGGKKISPFTIFGKYIKHLGVYFYIIKYTKLSQFKQAQNQIKPSAKLIPKANADYFLSARNQFVLR